MGTASRQVGLPYNLLWIGDGAYINCEQLTSAHLPEHTTEQSAEMFKGCASLKKMELPGSLQSIGREAFVGCDSFIDLIVLGYVTAV